MIVCRHLWETVAVKFTPARYSRVGGASQELMERLAFGVTNITQQCEKCGQVRVVTAAGEATAPMGTES